MIRSFDWRGGVLPMVLLLAAEMALRLQPVADELTFARPSEMVAALFDVARDGSLLETTRQTLAATFGGWALGGGLGLLAGLLTGIWTTARAWVALPVELLRPVPSVALVPLTMLLFGFGYRMEIAVIAFSCFFPMLLLTQAALREVEPRLFEVARVLRLTPLDRILKIVLPAALPRIFVAFRLSIGIALVVAITVEITANPQGLGFALMSAQQDLIVSRMWADLLWVGAVGWALSAGLGAVQRRYFAPGQALGERR